MTRRPIFWVVFAAAGIAGAITAQRLFTVALPNVSIDIRMNRSEAMDAARQLATRFEWGPTDPRAAASFGQVDREVQTYVELEGGGRDAFVGLAGEGVYQPYQWTVRLFAEGEVADAHVGFAPDGTPYGFRLRLAEDDAGGGNLGRDAARTFAEAASADWLSDLASHDLVESSSETMPGGRVDHTFVYERRGVTLADARFRLRLVVAGDRLSAVTRFVDVPEAFTRRYADMRSTNDAIALVASGFFVLFFVLLGAGVGSAVLLRARWIEWKRPLVWGGVTALLFGLNSANALPLAWMGYDTAVSASMFVFQSIAAAAAIAVLGTPVLAFFFMAGESLGRRAFPAHVQQWRFWSPEVARSRTALGLTTAAYCLVGLEVGYVVLFYLGTSRLEGWWSPADALVQPDLLATYAPWLQAVSISLFASFWEESIFRAVPIACAALIGARFGRKNLWVWGMVVLQAVVFAAGHANYPQQPAYARVVELSIPAMVWGAVYVYYGLVPTILTHFLYDLVLISSVLFASDARVDQIVVLGVALVPLAIVLWHRRGGRGTDRPPVDALNGAWRPPALPQKGESTGPPAPSAVVESHDGRAGFGTEHGTQDLERIGQGRPQGEPASEAAAGFATDRLDAASRDASAHLADPGPTRSPGGSGVGTSSTPAWLSSRTLASAGVLGTVLWVVALVLGEPGPRLESSRIEATAVAQEALAAAGYDVSGWSAGAFTTTGIGAGHMYVRDVTDGDTYRSLLGGYLGVPEWWVRFVDWDAPPETRVEEYRVRVNAAGQAGRVTHVVPEARAMESWTEDEARAAARNALRGSPAPDPGRLIEISAEEVVQPARTDWDFTFRDPDVLDEVAGEGRVTVSIRGRQVSDVRVYVHTPEEWERLQREEASRMALFSGGLGMTLFLEFGVAAVVAIVLWSRGLLAWRVGIRLGLLMFGVMCASAFNQWPATAAAFSTAQPRAFQSGGAAFGILLVSLVGAAATGLVAALAHSWLPRSRRAPVQMWQGWAAGVLVAGAGSAAGLRWSGIGWPIDYSGAESFVPQLAAPLSAVTAFLLLTSGILVIASTRERFSGHAVMPSVTGFAILAMGVLVVPAGLQESLWSWIPAAAVSTLLVFLAIQVSAYRPGLAPLITGTLAGTTALESAIQGGYPGAHVGGLLAAAAILGVAWTWSRWLQVPDPGHTTQSEAATVASVGSE